MWDRFTGGKTWEGKWVRSWRKLEELAEDGASETLIEARGRKEGRAGKVLDCGAILRKLQQRQGGRGSSTRSCPSEDSLVSQDSPGFQSLPARSLPGWGVVGGASHGKHGLGEIVVRDFCHCSWSMHNAWCGVPFIKGKDYVTARPVIEMYLVFITDMFFQ